jgi:biotin transport system substrate-specific component
VYTSNFNKIAVKVTPKEGEFLARAVLFAALTGIGALIRIPLSPVPVTMQVFFVLLSGLVLGPVWGPLSQLMYLGMGLCGAPFFAAPPYAGPLVLFGPTGGYLWGFVLASGVVGLISRMKSTKTMAKDWKAHAWLLAACLAGVAAIYSAGTGWLAMWLGLHGKNAALAFELGVKPFILIDTLKAIMAASIGVHMPLKI